MTVHDLSIVESTLIEAWVAGPLFGINVVLFCMCTGVLWKRDPRRSIAARYLLIVTTLQLVIAAGHISTLLTKIIHAFVSLAGKPGGTLAFLADFTTPLHTAEQALYTINDIIAGCILTWRCYVVWDYNWRPCVPLVFSCAGTAVAGLGSIVTLSLLSPGFDNFFTTPLRAWLISFWVLSFLTQVGATTCIAWKIWSAIAWRAKARGSTEWAILRIFVESGAVYTAATLVVLVLYLLGTAAGTIVAGMLGQLSTTAPYLIIVRAEMQRASAMQRDPEYVTAATARQDISLSDMDVGRNKGRKSRFGPAAFRQRDSVVIADLKQTGSTTGSTHELPPGW